MSVKKVMLIPFFDSRGLVHWEYFKDQTITKEIFLPVLQRVRQSLLSRRSDISDNLEEYLLHMDNAPAHRSDLVQSHLREINWSTLKHPPYSLDLSPSDFFLFPRIKKHLRGIRFPSLDALVVTIERQL